MSSPSSSPTSQKYIENERHRSRPMKHHRKHKHKHEHRERPSKSHHKDRDRSRSPLDDQYHHEERKIKQEPQERHDRHKHTRVKREHDDRGQRRHPVKQEPDDSDYHRGYQESRHRDNQERDRHNRRRVDHHRQREAEDDQDWGTSQEQADQPKDKEKPNFGLSGKLTEEANTYKGVVIKYNEPPEARKPRKRWRLYPFKGDDALPVLHIHRQSAFLLGRDRRIADIPVDHPSCSKQHAVLQYRLVPYQREDGTKGQRVKPYVIDLGSANGTYVNNQRIEAERYVELIEKDVIKFGFSSREYVILHDNVDVSEVDYEESD